MTSHNLFSLNCLISSSPKAILLQEKRYKGESQALHLCPRGLPPLEIKFHDVLPHLLSVSRYGNELYQLVVAHRDHSQKNTQAEILYAFREQNGRSLLEIFFSKDHKNAKITTMANLVVARTNSLIIYP